MVALGMVVLGLVCEAMLNSFIGYGTRYVQVKSISLGLYTPGFECTRTAWKKVDSLNKVPKQAFVCKLEYLGELGAMFSVRCQESRYVSLKRINQNRGRKSRDTVPLNPVIPAVGRMEYCIL